MTITIVTLLLSPDITVAAPGIPIGKIKIGARSVEADPAREENGQRPVRADLGIEIEKLDGEVDLEIGKRDTGAVLVTKMKEDEVDLLIELRNDEADRVNVAVKNATRLTKQLRRVKRN